MRSTCSINSASFLHFIILSVTKLLRTCQQQGRVYGPEHTSHNRVPLVAAVFGAMCSEGVESVVEAAHQIRDLVVQTLHVRLVARLVELQRQLPAEAGAPIALPL